MDDNVPRAPAREGSRFRAAHVVGKQPVAVKRVAIASPGGPPRPLRASFGQPTRPGFTPASLVGVLVVALSILGLVLNFTLPWIENEGGNVFGFGADTLDRRDLADGAASGSTYASNLLVWPLLTYIAGMVVGLGLLALDLVPNLRGVQRTLQLILLASLAYFGFLLALTGSRWLGVYFTELLDTGEASFHLHVVPYVNLAFGLAMVAGALWALRAPWRFFSEGVRSSQFGGHGVRVPALTALAAAGALWVLPLLPYAVVQNSFLETRTYLGEFTLDFFRDFAQGDLAKPGQDLFLARLMIWITLYVSVAAVAFALVERFGALPLLWGTLVQVYAPLALLYVVGLVFTVLFYADVPKLEDASAFGGDVTVSFNHFLPVAYAALITLYAWYAVRVLGPYARSVNEQAAAAPPA